MNQQRSTVQSTNYESLAEQWNSLGCSCAQENKLNDALKMYRNSLILFHLSLQTAKNKRNAEFIKTRMTQVLEALNEKEKKLGQKQTSMNEIVQMSNDQNKIKECLVPSSTIQAEMKQTVKYPSFYEINATNTNGLAAYPTVDTFSNISQFAPTVDVLPVVAEPVPQPITKPPEEAKHFQVSPPTEAKAGRSHRKTKSRQQNVLLSDKILDIKQFSKERELGRGSFGSVILCTEKTTKNKFAIKFLEELTSADEQRAFLREVEVLVQAQHPAVLHLYGFSLKESNKNPYPFIVTEYLPNGSLEDVISGNKKFDNTKKMISLYGIASAMDYLHQLRIVHRDLKPANVMLNNLDEPVVGDFGLSKIMNQSIMRQTQAAGSPIYMAPELLRRADYSNKVDVYAYGVMIYELLTGQLAFEELQSMIQLIQAVCSGTRPSFKDVNLPENFQNLIKRCWDNNPDLRPTFREIQHELRKNVILNNVNMDVYKAYISKLPRHRSHS